MNNEHFVYNAEVNWSMLLEGITLPVKEHYIFARNMGRMLKRGESRNISLLLNGTSYKAQIRNVDFDPKFERANDAIQIRYPRNGELARALQDDYANSYQYLRQQRESRSPGQRIMLRLPEDKKEYLAIYATEFEDIYVFEPICTTDIIDFKQFVKDKPERIIETDFEIECSDKEVGIVEKSGRVRIRKLNRLIGENLKILYGYRCQICGQYVGEPYNTHTVESHHIDYFVKSLNNDAGNQMIVCPNHHSIIHEVNPEFDWRKLIFKYPNGYIEGLAINKHIPSII
ncbi:MAG: HNH endonuclease signature motif containing protein [Bacillota bacterium]